MKASLKSRTFVLWLLVLVWLVPTGRGSAATIGTITQITSDGATNGNPQISGSNLMWQFYDGPDYELKFYNGSTGTTTRLTTNSVDDYSLSSVLKQISGSTVVWDSNGEVYKSVNGGTAIAVGTTSASDGSASIDGSTIVWKGQTSGYYQVFKDTGSGPVQVTGNTNKKGTPAVSGSNVAWTEGTDGTYGHIYDVFLNGSQITDTSGTSEGNVRISGSNLAWTGSDEVFFYNGTTSQLTSNSYSDENPQIYGSNVVWEGHAPTGYDIFLFNGTSTTNITESMTGYHYAPQVSDQYVVWQGTDQAGSDTEIFLYDMLDQSITQVTNNTFSDYAPQISGMNLTWYGTPPSSDGDIYFTSFTGSAVPEPSSMVALAGLLGMGLIGYLRRRRKSR